MAIQKILIDEFLQLVKLHPVLDVRSPAEYAQAHIPTALSLPLFSDEERKVVGTAYKQESQKTAIKIGLDYFGVKMRGMVEQVEALFLTNMQNATEPKTVLVHCWRGGMRSSAVAWLLDLYGFKVYLLSGGYKKYRQWAREQFDRPYPLTILGGYTGSGKTLVLMALKKQGRAIIDLEGLAHHKGSSFGAMGQQPQPSQEMFENVLAESLAIAAAQNAEEIFLEDESQRIGQINIPTALWQQMRQSPILFLDVPFADRLDHITADYGIFEKEKIVNAVLRIQKRLGGLETKLAINFLIENNHRDCFGILLKYYDKYYEKGLNNRENLTQLLTKITCTGGEINYLTQKLLDEKARL